MFVGRFGSLSSETFLPTGREWTDYFAKCKSIISINSLFELSLDETMIIYRRNSFQDVSELLRLDPSWRTAFTEPLLVPRYVEMAFP